MDSPSELQLRAGFRQTMPDKSTTQNPQLLAPKDQSTINPLSISNQSTTDNHRHDLQQDLEDNTRIIFNQSRGSGGDIDYRV